METSFLFCLHAVSAVSERTWKRGANAAVQTQPHAPRRSRNKKMQNEEVCAVWSQATPQQDQMPRDKPTTCICENKDQLISVFVFAT